MGGLTANALLRAWELALPQAPSQRALTLARLVEPELPAERLAALPVGQRDGLLLELRERAFGSQMKGLATCPACARQLELSFPVGSIRVPTPINAAGPYTLTQDGYEVEFRLPNTEDVACLTPALDPIENESRLLGRCLLNARREGEPVPPVELPTEVKNAISQRMAEADPQADVRLSLACPDCDHHWLATFDILSYLWTEVQAWATRFLGQIHTLASAYGWREADILALSPWRRQVYLEMIQR